MLLKGIVVLDGKTLLLIIFIDLLIVIDTQYCFEFQTCYNFIFPPKVRALC